MVRTVMVVTAAVAFTFGAAFGLHSWLDDRGASGTVVLNTDGSPVADGNDPGGGSYPNEKPNVGSDERPIAITETEYKVTVATRTLTPGKYYFSVRNVGTIEHAINFDGPNLEDASTGSLKPGRSGELALTLVAGTYRVYCPMPHHKTMGMRTTITVG